MESEKGCEVTDGIDTIPHTLDDDDDDNHHLQANSCLAMMCFTFLSFTGSFLLFAKTARQTASFLFFSVFTPPVNTTYTQQV